MRKRSLLALALLLGLGWGAGPSPAPAGPPPPPADPAQLAPQHRQWLLEVDLLLRKEERAAFLALHADYERDGFIQKFWESRDPNPRNPGHPLKAARHTR